MTALMEVRSLLHVPYLIRKVARRKPVMKKTILLLTVSAVFTMRHAMAEINPEAEKYISKMLNKQTPYQVELSGCKFLVNSVHAYPPGKLTSMFANYLIDNNLLKDRRVGDIGCGCFALGIIAAKNGAEAVIGTDVSKYALQCARDNLALNGIQQKVDLFETEGLASLLPLFAGKIDILLSGAPWDSMPYSEFKKIRSNRKFISRSFYDIDDQLITAVMTDGFDLLSPQGKIFITSSINSIGRIKQLCLKHELNYKIVKQEDLHDDGNIHYILELTRRPA